MSVVRSWEVPLCNYYKETLITRFRVLNVEVIEIHWSWKFDTIQNYQGDGVQTQDSTRVWLEMCVVFFVACFLSFWVLLLCRLSYLIFDSIISIHIPNMAGDNWKWGKLYVNIMLLLLIIQVIYISPYQIALMQEWRWLNGKCRDKLSKFVWQNSSHTLCTHQRGIERQTCSHSTLWYQNGEKDRAIYMYDG